MKEKNILRLIYAIAGIIAIIGGTFAWLSYRTNGTSLVLTIGDVDGMTVTVKPYKLSGTLPVTDYYTTEGKVIDVTVVNKSTDDQIFTLYFDVESIDPVLKASSFFKYKVVKSTNNGSTYSDVQNGTGNFNNATNGGRLNIYNETVSTNTNNPYLYKVYIWIDEDSSNQADIEEKIFKAQFKADISSDGFSYPNEPNAPVLSSGATPSGLIPVKLSSDGTTVTVVSEDDPTWYDYDQQLWANAVLVKSSGINSRATNSTIGNVIPLDDIIAYYVWIPRYSYVIRTYSNTPSPFDIYFTHTSDTKRSGNVGSYYTPTSFSFDIDDDGTDEELAGIWVGKFELSHATKSTSNLGCTTTSCADSDGLQILPSKTPLRVNSISSFFYAVRSMQQSGNAFNLETDSTKVDSHLIKNSEYGAIAYLGYSQFGNDSGEVAMNNGQGGNYMTGYDDNLLAYATSGTSAYPQSTTGNITGVFDLNGAATEYTMGHYCTAEGGITENENAGFGAEAAANPAAKYYNCYSTEANCMNGTNDCKGHAINETHGWFGDVFAFVSSSSPWTRRSGNWSFTTQAGVYYISGGSGADDWSIGGRAALIVY